MPAAAIYDANVLYPSTLRDLLIRVARAGLVRARWTEQILDEMSTALRRNRPDIDGEKLQRLRTLMNDAVRDCLVTGYQELIGSLVLPDPDDRHVLAAAIVSSSSQIITWNLRDFPAETLAQHGVWARTPDDFLGELVDSAGPAVRSCIQDIAESRRIRPQTPVDVLRQLEADGLVRTVMQLSPVGT